MISCYENLLAVVYKHYGGSEIVCAVGFASAVLNCVWHMMSCRAKGSNSHTEATVGSCSFPLSDLGTPGSLELPELRQGQESMLLYGGTTGPEAAPSK